MNDKLLYRIPDVAEQLSISRSRVYELLKSGELRSVHIDRSRLVAPVTFRRTLPPWPPLRDCQHHCETSGRTRSSAKPKSIHNGNPLTPRHRQPVHGHPQTSNFS
jgi:excisionase family DNA binding protein